jgi:hypothetical protein
LHRLRWAVTRAAAGRTHLRQPRHVGIAQHEADVGMRDQPALRVDDIGVPVLADLDLRDHIPNQLEIHLSNTHARVAPGAGNGERHIWLGLAPEIDWPVIYLARYSFRKLRVIREVGSAGDDIHGQPRDPQTLFAAGIELCKLGNGRHLAQQPQGVEAALLDGPR